jgi:hypothetical protein
MTMGPPLFPSPPASLAAAKALSLLHSPSPPNRPTTFLDIAPWVAPVASYGGTVLKDEDAANPLMDVR